MFIRCCVGSALAALCVGILAAIGAGSSGDPFATLGIFGAYLMILAAILGGIFLALALSAGADQDRAAKRRPR
jgi:hypothetical protein